MSSLKRQHYIPQMLLRNFADKKDKLHCYYKPEGKLFETSPENVFLQSRLYTHYDRQGNKDSSVEQLLSKIEGETKLVLNKMIAAARHGIPPRLTAAEKNVWDTFFCYQWSRLPTHRQMLSDQELISDVLDYAETKIGPIPASIRDEFDDPQRQTGIVDNAWIQSLKLRQSGDLMEVIRRKGIILAVITNPKKSFVIGDDPIIKTQSDLRLPETKALFPIAHDVLVTPSLSSGEENVVPLDNTDYIRRVNVEMFRRSETIAGRSRRLIQSLSRAKRRK